MSTIRFICVLMGCLLPVAAHSEQMTDTFPLYAAICLASNGKLEQAATLAKAHGFKADSGAGPIEIYRRAEQTGSSLPTVVFKRASQVTDGLDVCEVVGESRLLSSFLEEVRVRNMMEVPKEAVLGSLADGTEANYYIARDCDVATLEDGCFIMSAVGSAVEDGKFDGVFRFSIIPLARA